MRKLNLILAALVLGLGAPASAAMAADVCQGSAAAPGAVLHGPVLEVSDGASLCIASGASPTAWTRVSVRQLGASRPLLMAAAFGQNATCRIGADGAADCTIDGARLADTVNRPEVIKASLQWRQRLVPTQIASATR
jgi:hypothetical protein